MCVYKRQYNVDVLQIACVMHRVNCVSMHLHVYI